MDNKTIEICPHCGRFAWWPELACVHCSCELVDYKTWIKADDDERRKILSKKFNLKNTSQCMVLEITQKNL